MKTIFALALAVLALPGCMVVPVAERPIARPVFVTPAPAYRHYPQRHHHRRHHDRRWR